MEALSVIALVVITLSGVTCDLCSDLDTSACLRLISAKPDFCATSPLSNSACKRTCGHCPLTCYHCPSTPVRDPKMCKNTMICPSNEDEDGIRVNVDVPKPGLAPVTFVTDGIKTTCVIKTLYAKDGHTEHLMTCENTMVCNGFGFGFNPIGKRDVQRRDIKLHCCHSDMCNTPDFTTTTVAPTQHPPTVPNIYSCHNDVIFVVDESGSIGPGGFNKVVAFITDMVKRLDIGIHATQVGLLVYDNLPHVEWFLKDYTTKAGLLSALTYVPYHDGTSRTDLALQYTSANMFQYSAGDRLSAKNVIVVITDGRSTAHSNVVVEGQRLRTEGVTVVALGVGSVRDQELIDVATDGKHALKVTGYDHLPNAIPMILPLICA